MIEDTAYRCVIDIVRRGDISALCNMQLSILWAYWIEDVSN